MNSNGPVLTMLAALAVSACPSAGTGGPIPFHPIAGARGPANGLDGTMYRPPGAGPFPVVIVLQGCGGLGANQKLWADRLNGWGYAAFVLDRLGPRGLRSVCAPAARDSYQRVRAFLDHWVGGPLQAG